MCGLAFIYVLAPLLDNFIRKVKRKILLPIALVLLILLSVDVVYSMTVPNTGYGITGNFDNDNSITVETVIDE